MLKQPLFRAGLVVIAASFALVFMPFYDRYSAFAVVNLILAGVGLALLFAGAVKADRAEARAEGRKPTF